MKKIIEMKKLFILLFSALSINSIKAQDEVYFNEKDTSDYIEIIEDSSVIINNRQVKEQFNVREYWEDNGVTLYVLEDKYERPYSLYIYKFPKYYKCRIDPEYKKYPKHLKHLPRRGYFAHP